MRSALFSKKAEYACVAMMELAARHRDPQPVPLKIIHETHGISLRFLVQILLHLRGAGLVLSTRGAAGGYRLARAPEEISLADIVGVIDRPETTPKQPKFDSPAFQALHSVWQDIEASRQNVLRETTLATLIRRIEDRYAPMYQI